MKIKNQFISSIIIFSIVMLIMAVSFAVTSQQAEQLSKQSAIALSIERGTEELSYLSNDYFLYQESQQLSRWQSKFASLSNDTESLNPTTTEEQTLVNNIEADLQRLNAVFTEVVSYLETAPRNVSVRIDPAFQISWSRMAVQNQGLAFDAAQLSKVSHAKADQLEQMNLTLIFALLGMFGAYFLTNYVIVYRRTLKSISKLQSGIGVIGSGNLDYRIETKRQDEIGELTHAFNQMTTNLKAVTASKTELENEVTERQKVETALRESEQKWSTTLKSIGDAVIATDTNGKITFMNGVAEELTGWTLSDASIKPLREVFHIINEHTRKEVENPIDKVLEKGLVIGLANHTVLVRKDGTEVPIDDSGAPIKDENGKITGIVLVFHDITERKEMEEQIEQYSKNLERLVEEKSKQLKDSERLAAIGQTAGMVGHDIRNPLQAIIGDVYLAKGDVNSLPQTDAKENLQESLAAIEKNTEYINKIVADLQDFAKPLNPHAEETELKPILEDLLFKNMLPDNITPKIKVAKEAQKLVTDSAYIKRILGNLISNAVQAMPNGGNLTINAYTEDGDAVITVEDTGVGIPEEAKQKLFQPLFTTKSKGQGFGLAVVKRLTEALNGTITFQSQQDKGTTFTIRLPKKT